MLLTVYWTFSYGLIVKFDVLHNTHHILVPNGKKGNKRKKKKTSNSKQVGAFVYFLGVKNRNSVDLISVAINKVVLTMTGSCFLFGCSCLVLVWPISVVHSFLPIPRQVRINWLQYEIGGRCYFFQKGNNIDTMSFSCFMHL